MRFSLAFLEASDMLAVSLDGRGIYQPLLVKEKRWFAFIYFNKIFEKRALKLQRDGEISISRVECTEQTEEPAQVVTHLCPRRHKIKSLVLTTVAYAGLKNCASLSHTRSGLPLRRSTCMGAFREFSKAPLKKK